MSESPWALKLLFIATIAAFFIVLVGVSWLIVVSPLPDLAKYFLSLLVGGSGVFGGVHARHRLRAGQNPWSLNKPERG